MDILESIEENQLCITCIICVVVSYPPTMLAMATTRTNLISPLLPTSHNVKWVEHQLYNYIIDFLAYNRNWCEMRISSNSVNSSRQHKYSNGVDIVSNHIYFDSILLWLSLHSNDFSVYCIFVQSFCNSGHLKTDADHWNTHLAVKQVELFRLSRGFCGKDIRCQHRVNGLNSADHKTLT